MKNQNTKTKISNKWATSKNGVKTAFKNVKKRVSSADTKITRVLAKSELPRKLINAGLDGVDLVSYTLEVTTGLARNMKNGASESKCACDIAVAGISTITSMAASEYIGSLVTSMTLTKIAGDALMGTALLAGATPVGMIAIGMGMIFTVLVGVYIDSVIFSDRNKTKISKSLQVADAYAREGEMWNYEQTTSGKLRRQPAL